MRPAWSARVLGGAMRPLSVGGAVASALAGALLCASAVVGYAVGSRAIPCVDLCIEESPAEFHSLFVATAVVWLCGMTLVARAIATRGRGPYAVRLFWGAVSVGAAPVGIVGATHIVYTPAAPIAFAFLVAAATVIAVVGGIVLVSTPPRIDGRGR